MYIFVATFPIFASESLFPFILTQALLPAVATMTSLLYDHANNRSQLHFPRPITGTSGSYSNSLSLLDATWTDEDESRRLPSPNDPLMSQDRGQIGHISRYRQPISLAWATIVILGQLIIPSIAWGFFALVYQYGPIPLPDKMASRAATHQSTVTLVITLVGTTLSLVSALYVHYTTSTVPSSNIPYFLTSLFRRAMRFALTARFFRPISFFAFSSAVEVSRGSVVMNLRHAQWTIVSLICAIALSTMTAG